LFTGGLHAERSAEFKKLTKQLNRYIHTDIDSAKIIWDKQKSLANTASEKFEVETNYLNYLMNIGNDVKIEDQVKNLKIQYSPEHLDLDLKIIYHDLLGRNLYSNAEYNSAIEQYNIALADAKTSDEYRYYQCLLYYRILGCYDRLGNDKLERLYADSSLNYSEFKGIQSKIYNYLGGEYFKKNQLDSAIYYLEQASSILLSNGDIRTSLNIRINISNIYKAQRRYKEAISILSEVMVSATEQKYDYSYYLASLNALEAWAAVGECDSVMNHGPKLAYYYKTQKKENFLAYVFVPLAQCYLRNGMYDKAKGLLLDGLEIQNNLGDSSNHINILSYLGKAYEFSDIDKAIYYYDEGLKLAINSNKPEMLTYCAEGLSNCYSKLNRFEKSLGYYKIFKQYSDSTQELDLQQRIFKLDASYKLTIADQEKQLLEDQLVINEGIRKYQRLINYLAVGGVVILMLILINIRLKYKTKRDNILKEKIALSDKMTELRGQIIQKNRVINTLNEELEGKGLDENLRYGIINDLRLERDWINFMSKVEQMFPKFFSNLNSKSDELTSNDLKFCALIKMDLNNDEIGDVLNITLAGIKKAKQRIRKKLAVQLSDTLKDYIADV
jgi:tetratricopeptide (TPR) repeat protein/DNA-binding CsgD family transcriptional regulator